MYEKLQIKKDCLGSDIIVECTKMDRGIHILIVSREYGHVGAVSHMEPGASLETVVYPKHKEKVICEEWAKAFYEKLNCAVTVCGGIHYENLSREGIELVMKCTNSMLEELLQMFTKDEEKICR